MSHRCPWPNEHTALGLNLAGGIDAILGCVVGPERDFQRVVSILFFVRCTAVFRVVYIATMRDNRKPK